MTTCSNPPCTRPLGTAQIARGAVFCCPSCRYAAHRQRKAAEAAERRARVLALLDEVTVPAVGGDYRRTLDLVAEARDLVASS